MAERHAVRTATQPRTRLLMFAVAVNSFLINPLTSAAMASTDKFLMVTYVVLQSGPLSLGWEMLAVVMYRIISMEVRYVSVVAYLNT